MPRIPFNISCEQENKNVGVGFQNGMSFAFDRIPHEASVSFSQYNRSNREQLFVPGGFAMHILVPWKPVVLVWGLLSGMILVSFVASSVLQGKDPFAPGARSLSREP
jgi:hypothetical protein